MGRFHLPRRSTCPESASLSPSHTADTRDATVDVRTQEAIEAFCLATASLSPSHTADTRDAREGCAYERSTLRRGGHRRRRLQGVRLYRGGVLTITSE